MLRKYYYYALKAHYWMRHALGLSSRKKYKEIKYLLKNVFYPDRERIMVGVSRRNWYKTNFDSYFIENKECLHEKYLRLIDGLDDESARTIQVIISRLMRYHQSGRALQKVLRFEATDKEIQIFKQAREDVYSRVIRFPNNTTAYKKWLLPDPDGLPVLEPEVFYSKCFIEEIDGLHQLKNKDIIDAGAYIGDSSLVLQDYTDKKVYAFDPSPRHIEKIFETIKLNNAVKIVPVALGLGDRAEELYIKGSALMGAESAYVKLTTLDEWVKNNNVEVGVVKVDIEGLEQKFLRGAIETIRKQKPALLMSIYHSASDMFEIKPFIENLNLGYKFKIRRAFDKHILRDTMLICEVKE